MRSLNDGYTDYTKFIAIFLGFISFVLLVFILVVLKEILVPVTVAGFLTLLFHPIVEYLQKYKIPKPVSIILILILICAVYYSLILILLPEINILPLRISEYAQRMLPAVQKFFRPFDITLEDLSKIINIDLSTLRKEDEVVQNLIKTGIGGGSVISIPALLNDLFLTLLFWLFMIAGKKKFELRLQKAFAENKQDVTNTINTIDGQMQYFILIESLIGVVYGIIVFGLSKIYGIEFAAIFGFLAFILNFIPKIGLIIGAVLPVLYSFLYYGMHTGLLLLAVFLVITVFVIARYIEPHFLGKYINLSPVFILFSLIFWGWIWGIAGFYLALPIAAIIRILFSNIKSLRPLAIILGSRVNLKKDALLNDNRIQEATK